VPGCDLDLGRCPAVVAADQTFGDGGCLAWLAVAAGRCAAVASLAKSAAPRQASAGSQSMTPDIPVRPCPPPSTCTPRGPACPSPRPDRRHDERLHRGLRRQDPASPQAPRQAARFVVLLSQLRGGNAVMFTASDRTWEPIAAPNLLPEDALLVGKAQPLSHRPTPSPQPAMLQSASVGDMPAARRAGSRPARAPMSSAAPIPPPQARAGMTMAQPLLAA
jgi:hypothetical protein